MVNQVKNSTIHSLHTVVEASEPKPGHLFITFQSPEPLPEISPGNFAEIEIPDQKEVFLRRPFSVMDADYQNNFLSFYIKVIGKGTRALRNLKKGDTVSVIHPLGGSFSIPENQNVLAVGGGSGIAPFPLLGKYLVKAGNRVTFLLGGRSANDIVLVSELQQYGKVEVTTEDGSLGHRGMVTDHPLFSGGVEGFDRIVTCGPEGMMKAVSAIAQHANIPCEVSLENLMACGFGVCLCCITPTVKGNLRVCQEGPVFNSTELKWND
ncbi:MAG: dihydroorotate dehydrogenase electron transfer subunit [Bacteroidales bacterium]